MSDWKKDLRDRFEDFREQEPEGLWSAIEAEIAPKKKALPLWWVAAVPAAAAVAALFLLPGRGVDTPALSSPEKAVAVVTESVPEEGEEPLPADTLTTLQQQLEVLDHKKVVAVVPSAAEIKARSAGLVPQEVSAEIQTETAEAPAEEVATEVAAEDTARQTEQNTAHETVQEPAPDTAVQDDKTAGKTSAKQESLQQKDVPVSEDAFSPSAGMTRVPIRRAQPQTERFSFGLAREAGSAATATEQGYGSGPVMKRSAAGPNYNSLARLLTSNQPTTTEATHAQPVRIGLNVSFALTPALSLETGLFHTTLSSYLTSGTESVYTRTDQRLDCIGIPLRLRCRITPPTRMLSLYSTAGGSWEKGYSLRRDNVVFISDAARDKNRETLDPDFIQWTAGAAVGVQLRPGNVPFAIFAEPGIEYRFANGSEIRTAYSDKPLSPSLTVGARFLIGSR